MLYRQDIERAPPPPSVSLPEQATQRKERIRKKFKDGGHTESESSDSWSGGGGGGGL
jgi:hypothetical protein